jgi:two-component system sensor histidine kinase BaeS
MATWKFGALGTRLAVTLIGVAFAVIAIFALATLTIENIDVGRLAATQRAQTAKAVASALDSAYRANGAWTGAALEPAVALANTAGAALALDAPDGSVLLRSGPGGSLSALDSTRVRQPLLVLGQEVGVLRLAFPAGGLSPADRRLRTELAEALGVSAGLAVLVAVVVAGLATPVLVRPIRRLTAAVRALQTGARQSRVGEPAGPGELGELGRTFDVMAASLEHQEQIRRTMLADVAHELRTPLAILQAETESLVDGVSDPTPEALASLHQESIRLGRLVEDLQTLASAEAAGLSLERRLVDLAAIAAGAADSVASRFRATGLDLEQTLSPAVVWADPDRIRQVVANLLINAAKFTPPGGRVDLVVRAAEASAYLEVADTGPGVPPDEQERIFERFFRGAAGRKVSGTGIGLTVVKELVQAHDGEIQLQSSSGEGARFIIRLPLVTDRPPDRNVR